MFCPKCGHEKTEVELTENGMIRRRSRKCVKCKFRFYTAEVIEVDACWAEYKTHCQQIGLFDHLGDKNEKNGVR